MHPFFAQNVGRKEKRKIKIYNIMNCEKCHEEIDEGSNFCELCGAKVENEIGKHAKMNAFLRAERDLESLRSKPWYRFLKILYIAGFSLSIFYVFADAINTPIKVFKNNDVIIKCEGFRQVQEKIRDRDWLSRYDFINSKIIEHNEIVESCDGKDSYVNIDIGVILKYFAVVFFVIVIFELLRQLGYYIFLGKFYHTWFTSILSSPWD